MSEVDEFLRDAAARAETDVEGLLSRVFHVDDGALAEVLDTMEPGPRSMLLRLDRELRLRNPGLHYVVRKMFIGYRREGDTPSTTGERSQIFVSVLRKSANLVVILPVDASEAAGLSNARNLQGTGHHGVGDVSVALTNDAELERFLSHFDYWLRPRVDIKAGPKKQ